MKKERRRKNIMKAGKGVKRSYKNVLDIAIKCKKTLCSSVTRMIETIIGNGNA
jgi:hypothetical protein